MNKIYKNLYSEIQKMSPISNKVAKIVAFETV